MLPLINMQTYLEQILHPEEPLLLQLRLATEALPAKHMCSGRIVSKLLYFLVSISKAKRVLELGTFSGYASLHMAAALPYDGQLITYEKDIAMADMAQKYFNASEHGHKIHLQRQVISNELSRLQETAWDLIFIDADKQNYLLYYQALVSSLAPGGIIVIDNALWQGSVLSPDSLSAKAIKACNDYIQQDPRVDNLLLDIRDGVHVIWKKA
jgi:caffeoyl-CoA O-methyltransferase